MNIQIINTELKLNISGFSGIAEKDCAAAGCFKLMDKMWPIVKAKGLKHKGLNIWVYGPGQHIFAGVELEYPSATETGLQLKEISLPRYAYYKHIGPYNQLKQAGDAMQQELLQMGLEPKFPYIEIYGHWTNDETKLETELLVALE